MKKGGQLIFLLMVSVLVTVLVSINGYAFPHVYDSVYNHLIIFKEGSVVYFKRMENGAITSAIDVNAPSRQVIPYTRLLFTPIFFKAKPGKVLSIGLGAGAFNRLFNIVYPESSLVTVEIDSMVNELAKKYTGFYETMNNRVAIDDGRVFLRRSNTKWDWIVLDAYVKRSQIPPHLTTLEFYELIKKRLTPDGILVSNLYSGTALFDSHVATLKRAFNQVLFFKVGDSSKEANSIVAVCANYINPVMKTVLLNSKAESLPNLKKYNVDFKEIKLSILSQNDRLINQRGQILTDDFAPVEFLEIRKK
jgi:spermidine synthase